MNTTKTQPTGSLRSMVRPITHVWVMSYGMNYDYGSSFGGVFATKRLALKHKATLRLRKGTKHTLGDWWLIERHEVKRPNVES